MATHWVFVGDSITRDFGASDEAHGYVSLFAGYKGLFIIRYAQPGRTLQKVTTGTPLNSLENVFFTPTSEQIANEPNLVHDNMYAGVSIRIGINDVFGRENGGSTSTFKSMYQDVLDYLYDNGWPKYKIHIINIGRYRNDTNDTNDAVQLFNAKIAELCTENGIQLLNQYTLDEANGTTDMYELDKTHPSDLGHLKTAQMMDTSISLVAQELIVKHGHFILG